MSARAAGRGGVSYRAPTTIETIRLDLTVFERALAAGDDRTARRAVDAAEAMFHGLRDVATAAGCDVGPPVWHAEPPPPIVEEPTQQILPPPPVVPALVVAPWLLKVDRREWSWRVLARLTWVWAVCAWSLVRRGFRRG
jgi:hypothetical protein